MWTFIACQGTNSGTEGLGSVPVSQTVGRDTYPPLERAKVVIGCGCELLPVQDRSKLRRLSNT
jgi:hypothetical protein